MKSRLGTLLVFVHLLLMVYRFAQESVLGIFSSFDLCDHTYSWLLAILMLIFASMQWQLVGFALAEPFRTPADME